MTTAEMTAATTYGTHVAEWAIQQGREVELLAAAEGDAAAFATLAADYNEAFAGFVNRWHEARPESRKALTATLRVQTYHRARINGEHERRRNRIGKLLNDFCPHPATV